MLRLYRILFLSSTIFGLIRCDVIGKANNSFNDDAKDNSAFSDSINESLIFTNSEDLLLSTVGNPTTDSNNILTMKENNTQLNSTNLKADIPIATNNSIMNVSMITVNDNNINNTKSSETEHTFKLSNKMDNTVTNPDDMPTFIEYQQRIEKESKERREKSDSIPNSPTLIQKNQKVVKGKGEQISVQTQGDYIESMISPASLKLQEIKDDSESVNLQKSEDQKMDVTTSILSKSLMKNNVVAKECGAKILEISGQIKHANFILNNNKDEYLNVPCTAAEKWFIVETCEPVQIRSIQIANFEMFSSRPKTFRVTTADRYPVKQWHNLGMFRALDEKGLQTFEVSDTRMVKYLKFEMIDHYGNEHYCPLTFVRVMGNVVIDDMDEEHSERQSATEEESDVLKVLPPKIQSDGLLTKAKDMIAKIVHGIARSKVQETGTTNEIHAEIFGNFGITAYNTSQPQSPCYFLEFLMNNYQQYSSDIFSHFLRLKYLGRYIINDTVTDIQLIIQEQPYPFQIRVEYFTLLDWINKTKYSFSKLYQSFSNVSSPLSEAYLFQYPGDSLSNAFKCHVHYRLPMIKETYSDIPESIEDGKTNLNDITDKTEIVLEADVHERYKTTQSVADGQHIANATSIDENLSNVNTTNTSSKSDNRESSTQTKYKSDDLFDQKVLSNPGNNAWNYAFMRIINIAKELEVNVSMSMTYLEDLSQNYKQQTDKLKKAQLEMATNVTDLENIINQHRQETRLYLRQLKVQLHAILLRLKMTLPKSVNLSTTRERDSDSACVDLLAQGLTLPTPSVFDSAIFVTLLNISFTLLCNVILLSFLYKMMYASILNDVTGVIDSSHRVNFPVVTEAVRPKSVDFDYVDTSVKNLRENIVDLQSRARISNCDESSDEENVPMSHRECVPLFYPVRPSASIAAPITEKKKRRKR